MTDPNLIRQLENMLGERAPARGGKAPKNFQIESFARGECRAACRDLRSKAKP